MIDKVSYGEWACIHLVSQWGEIIIMDISTHELDIKTVEGRKVRFALVGCGRIANNHFACPGKHTLNAVNSLIFVTMILLLLTLPLRKQARKDTQISQVYWRAVRLIVSLLPPLAAITPNRRFKLPKVAAML